MNDGGNEKHLAAQIRSVRAELDEATIQWLHGKPGAKTQTVALRRDLLVLEERLRTARRDAWDAVNRMHAEVRRVRA